MMSKANSQKEMAATVAPEAAKQNKHHHYHANSAHAQRQRMVEWFRVSPSLTTEQARRELDIMSPAARIKELRQSGCDIVTYWADYPTVDGALHRMARYVCMKNGGGHE